MVRSFHVVEIVGTTCELVGTSRVCFNHVVRSRACACSYVQWDASRHCSALRNCTFPCCDVQYWCRTRVSGVLIFTFVSSARVHEKVTWFQRHVTPSRESRDASTFTSPELWPQVVKWLKRRHKSCPRSPRHEKNAPLIVMIYCVIVKYVYSWQGLSASRNRLK